VKTFESIICFGHTFTALCVPVAAERRHSLAQHVSAGKEEWERTEFRQSLS
jgi:hypothetical protein